MVGLFINTLPLRVKIDLSLAVEDWLQKLHEANAESVPFQWTPLAKIQSWSDLSKRESGLFESILVYENYPIDAAVSAQQSLLNIHSAESIEKPSFPLTVIVCPTNTAMQIVFLYDTGRFSKSTITLLAETTTQMLAALVNVTDEKTTLEHLSLLPPWQLEKLKQWNNTRGPVMPATIIENIQARAELCPDAIAAVYEDEQISYAQLETRANQLANYLYSTVHIRPGSFIAVCMHRSLEMLVSFLAIWKLGCAYVPIDPTYPDARQQFLIENANSVLVLAQRQTSRPSSSSITVRTSVALFVPLLY